MGFEQKTMICEENKTWLRPVELYILPDKNKTRIPLNAMVFIKFLPYMGMAAILVM